MVHVDDIAVADSLIQVRGLDKTYRRANEDIDVLQGLNLDVDKGDFVAFMGPSGSGKDHSAQPYGRPRHSHARHHQRSRR